MRAPNAGRIALLLSLVPITNPATAQDWPHWRGPHHNGATTASNLPIDFNRKKRVLWSTPMPGPGASTPVVVGERIFLSSVDNKVQKLVALGLDRASGKIVWRHEVAAEVVNGRATLGGQRATFASPSPVADAFLVVFFFGNGELLALDHAGKLLWRRNLQQEFGSFAINFSFSASPTIVGDSVILPVLQRDTPVGRRRRSTAPQPAEKIDSYLLGVERKTGKTIYRHIRPSPAKVESLESYTSVVPWNGKDGVRLVLAGGDVLTLHDPATGKEVGRWGTWNPGHLQRAWRLVPTPVLAGDLALVCAPKSAPVFAIKLGAVPTTVTADATDATDATGAKANAGSTTDPVALAWQSEGRPNPVSTDVPTPAFAQGHFYVLNDLRHCLSKVKADSGKVVWTVPLPREHLWRASPTVADGKVFCINHNGQVVVVDAEGGKMLHHAFMSDDLDADQVRSGVIVAGNRLFVRTNERLFCIGQ